MLPLNRIHNPNPAWYRGDFHLHTTASDGHYSPGTLARLARAEGLDFLAITDHNTVASFGKFGEDSDLLVIPGIEITLAEGHWNVFGIEGQPDWLAEVCVWNNPLSQKDLSCSITEFMRLIAGQGMLNSINHPLLRPWEWQDGTAQLQHMHCLEIWNDPDWPDNTQANPAAVQMWTRWLNAGYRISAIGAATSISWQGKWPVTRASDPAGQPLMYTHKNSPLRPSWKRYGMDALMSAWALRSAYRCPATAKRVALVQILARCRESWLFGSVWTAHRKAPAPGCCETGKSWPT
jgi:hypothetical protein